VSAILVFVEMAGDGPDRLSAEALGLAGRIAGTSGAEVQAVVVPTAADRDAVEKLAPGLGRYGVTTVHLAGSDRIASYAPAAWGAAVTGVVTGGS